MGLSPPVKIGLIIPANSFLGMIIIIVGSQPVVIVDINTNDFQHRVQKPGGEGFQYHRR
jgi:hypothetical protein